MGRFDIFKLRKKKTALDVLLENPLFQQQKAIFDVMNAMSAGDCDTDELPNGVGEFGLAPTNPIPTNTVLGSGHYLGRLCTADGCNVQNKRRGSTQVEGISRPIDIYDLSRADGTPVGTIYICPYHQRNSQKAPRGFRLASTGAE